MPLSAFYILSPPSWLTCLVLLLLEDGTLKVENRKSEIVAFSILMTHFKASGRFLLVHVPPQMSSFILVFKKFRPWFFAMFNLYSESWHFNRVFEPRRMHPIGGIFDKGNRLCVRRGLDSVQPGASAGILVTCVRS